MDLPGHPHHHAGANQLGGPLGVERRRRGLAYLDVPDPHRPGKEAPEARRVEDVGLAGWFVPRATLRPRHDPSHRLGLGGKCRPFHGKKHLGDLEEPHVGHPPADVVGGGLQQAGQQRGAQHSLFVAQRVDHFDSLTAHVVGREGQAVQVGLPDEREGDGFGISGAHEHVPQLAKALLLGGQPAPGPYRDAVPEVAVAVEPRHLLDQVHGPLHVGPPGGNGDLQRVVASDGEPEPSQQRGDVVALERDSEYPPHL